MARDSVWKSTFVLAAFSLSVANVSLWPMWRALVFASDSDRYYLAEFSGHDYLAVILAMLLVAACLFALVRLIASFNSPLAKWALLALLFFCSLSPVNFLRISNEDFVHTTLPGILPYLAVGLVIVATLVWRFKRISIDVLLTVGFMTFVAFSPLVVLTSAQALWKALTLERADRGAGEGDSQVRPPPSEGESRQLQRLVWIIFDELDQRILFADRPPGYAYPTFDAFREQSICGTRVAPVGGETKAVMPAYWTGDRVARAKHVSADRLDLMIEGSREFVPVSDFDHLFKRAFDLGASIGIAGYYHPYCRLFGAFVDRCVSFQDAAQPHASKDLFESIVWDLYSLSPNFRRINAIYALEGIRSSALEMVADPGMDFVVIHINTPHTPPLYDPKSDRLKYWSAGLSFADNIALSDKTLGEIWREMKEAGLWSETAVVVMSDHGHRYLAGYDSAPGAITLMIKMANQESGIEIDRELDSLVTKDLLLGVLGGELTTPETVASWLRDESPPRAEVPGIIRDSS